MAKQGKRLTSAYKDIDKNALYTLDEALKMLKNAPLRT